MSFHSEAIRPDGLPYEIDWRGGRYIVPSTAELTRSARINICESPNGEPVSCDSKDSWLSLCGLLPERETGS